MKAKILIVDDEPNILRLIGYALETAGYEIVAAKSGAEALKVVEAEQPDLVVLDLMLPDMSGLEVCQQLREKPQFTDLPIIMLSARAQVCDKVAGLKAGADEYVTKPVDAEEMIARVAALLERRASLVHKLDPSQIPHKGQIVAVYGPKGGVGRTVVATNLAVALRKVTKKQVILVDANMRLGDVGLIFNVTSKYGIAELMARADDLDVGLIDDVLVTHSSGISILTGPDQIEANGNVKIASLGKIFAKLQEMFAYIVVDLSSVLDECTQAILGMAGKIVLVTTPEISSLRNLQLFFERKESMQYAPEALLVVLNRYDLAVGIKVKDIEEIVRCRIASKIPSDGPLMVSSLEEGVPVVVSHPRKPVAKSLFQLAETIAKGWIEPSGGLQKKGEFCSAIPT